MTDELNKLENQDYTPGEESDNEDSDQAENNNNDAPSRLSALGAKIKERRRAIIIAGGVGLGGLTAGMFGFSMLSGPMMFVGIAQSFTQAEMGPTEEVNESRLGQALRFSQFTRDPGNAQNYRVGYVGRKLAGLTEQYMANRGIIPVYENSVLADFVDPDGNPIRVNGESFRDIETKVADGTTSRHTANMQRRSFYRGAMFKAGGLRGATIAAIGSRSFMRKAAINLRPLGNFRYEKSQSITENLKRMSDGNAEADREGNARPRFEGQDPADDSDAAQADSERAKGTAGEVEEIAESRATEGPDIARSKFETALRGGSAAMLPIAVACAADSLSKAGENVEHANVYMVHMRFGMRFIAIGYQLMSGEGADMEEMNLLAKQLYDEKTGLDYSAARSVQQQVHGKTAEQVEKGGYPDMFNSGLMGKRAEQSDLRKTVDEIEGFTPDAVCGALASDAAQIIFWAVDPVGELVEQQIMNFLTGHFMDDILRLIAGVPVDTSIEAMRGPDAGNSIMYGTFAASNEQARSFGDTPMSNLQTSEWKRYMAEVRQLDRKDQSLGERYFALTNPDSLVSSVARSLPRSFKQVASGLSNVGKNLSSSFAWMGAPFSRAEAQQSDAYDYGIDKVGMDVNLVHDPEFENPSANVARLKNAIAAHPDFNDINDLHEEFGKPCFNLDIKEGTGTSPTLEITPLDGQEDDGTIYSKLPGKCRRTDDFFTLYRFYVKDLMVMESAACYLGDDDSCKVIYGESLPEDEGADSSGGLPIGDAAELARQLLEHPNVSFTTDLGRQAVEDAAAGRPSKTESVRCGNTPSGEAPLSPVLLQALLTAAEKHQLGLGYFTNGCHSDGSLHYLGRAIDIGRLDGRMATGGDADRPFMQYMTGVLPDGSRMGEVNCSGIPINPINNITLHEDSCNHIHLAVP